jgi:hypothetical protein
MNPKSPLPPLRGRASPLTIIKELQRHRFGRRAESLPEDQLLLGLEEAEQIKAEGEEEAERADLAKRKERATKRWTNPRRAAGASAAHRDSRGH